MELKYELMDWFPDRPYSFNRTFMELKFAKIGSVVSGIGVLIVPLWN